MRPLAEASAVDELGRQVARWVEAGVIRRDQADAILAMEGRGAEPAGRRAVAVEILGYVGGVLALVAGIVLGAESWSQLGRWGRVAVLGAVVAALLGAGWRLRTDDGRIMPRLASVLWLAAVAAWAGLLAVLLGGRGDEAFDDPSLLVAGGSLALAVVLWAFERRALQQAALFVTAVATILAAGDGLGWAWEAVAGFGLLGVGAAWLALGRRRLIQPRRTAEALGALAVIAGPELLYAAGSQAWLWVGLAVALGLLVAGSTLGRPVLLGIGATALVLFLSEVAATWWRSLGAPLALLLAGLGLVGAAVALSRLRLRPGGGAATPPRPR
jgi:predicted membrane protein DUF2157